MKRELVVSSIAGIGSEKSTGKLSASSLQSWEAY